VLYYALKDASKRPFTYRSTDLGQFSDDARNTLEELAAAGHVNVTELAVVDHSGNRWVLVNKAAVEEYRRVLEGYSKDLLHSVDASIEKYGYLRGEQLRRIAHDDPALLKTPLFDIIFEENVPNLVELDLSPDECEDFELGMNPQFIAAMRGLIEGVESGGISIGQWMQIE